MGINFVRANLKFTNAKNEFQVSELQKYKFRKLLCIANRTQRGFSIALLFKRYESWSSWPINSREDSRTNFQFWSANDSTTSSDKYLPGLPGFVGPGGPKTIDYQTSINWFIMSCRNVMRCKFNRVVRDNRKWLAHKCFFGKSLELFCNRCEGGK